MSSLNANHITHLTMNYPFAEAQVLLPHPPTHLLTHSLIHFLCSLNLRISFHPVPVKEFTNYN